MKKFIILFMFLLFFSFNLYAQPDYIKNFNRFEMKFEQLMEDVFFKDLNDDNLKDALVITKVSDKKKLFIFYQSNDGFSPASNQILNFDEDAIIFDVGNISDRYQGKEIVYLTNTSIRYYHRGENLYNQESAKLIDISSIFQSPSPESPVRCRFIWDVDEGKLGYLFVPEPDKLKILSADKDEIYREIQKIDLDPIFSTRSQFSRPQDFDVYESFSKKVVIRVPLFSLEDFNGDKRKDIVSLYKDEIRVFFQNEKNEFSEKPDFQIELDVLTEKEKKHPSPPMFRLFATDLDNNGLIDFLVSKSQIQTMSSLSKTYIYLNKEGKIDVTPDQILVNESAFGRPEILDIDGDNHKDLIVSELKMGLFQILKMLITKKLSYEDAIYLGESGQYPKLPAAKIKSKIKFDFDNPGKSEGEIAYFSGDFNRDGVRDLLRKKDDKSELAIFLGEPRVRKKMFSEKASCVIQEELSTQIVIEDLNDDKASDIILDFRRDEKKKLVLFLSK